MSVSDTRQADVLRLSREIIDLPKRRLPSCKLVATYFGVILSPHSTREMKHISQELEWMHVEEDQPGSAGSGGMGFDEVVEPSSFVAAVTVCLSMLLQY